MDRRRTRASAYRTLVTYKESLDSAQTDPVGPADLDRRLGGSAVQPAG